MLIRWPLLSKFQTINSSVKKLVQSGQPTKALQLYTNLWNHGFKPDNYTFPYILKASSQLQHPTMGLVVHNHVITTGFDTNLFVGNSLIIFYAQFGQLHIAHQLFDGIPHRNVVTWTAIISAHAQNDRFDIAIELFYGMRVAGVEPNSFTMATILPGLSGDCQKEARQLHGFSIRCGFESDIFVLTALVDAYGKCGSMYFARQLFDEMPQRNQVSWNTMIQCYNQNGRSKESLELFVQMQNSNEARPDSFSIGAVLCTCSSLTSLRQGKEIHGYTYRANLDREVFVGNGLIDMYGKCGDIKLGQRVFDKMPNRDVSSWTALITCYGLNGHGTKAISVFERMCQIGYIAPSSITFTAILLACSHSGLIEKGFKYFAVMSKDFGIEPTMKHYACMVDMLGRAGQLTKALKFIDTMPVRPDFCIWETLLGAASIRGDTATAEIAVKCLLELEVENADLNVQLSNIYAKAGQWEEVAKIRGKMRSMKVRKSPGVSLVRVIP